MQSGEVVVWGVGSSDGVREREEEEESECGRVTVAVEAGRERGEERESDRGEMTSLQLNGELDNNLQCACSTSSLVNNTHFLLASVRLHSSGT